MIRFYNGRVLTLAEDTLIRDWEVWTDGSVISYVGPSPAEMPVFEREIDLRGDVLMPGFKNAHTHSAMTFLRSFADDLPLQSWLFDKVFPYEAKLTPEDVYALTRLAIMEYLTSGITASFDMYFHLDEYVRANLDCGFRTVMCGAIAAGDDWKKLEANFNKYSVVDPLISYRLGFHAEYTASVPMLEYVSGLAHETKQPVWAHNSETESEVRECIERHGKTPTELFDSLGIFDFGGGGFHCVHFSENDMEIFKNRSLWAVTNPSSNLKLASGVAPIVKMQEMGINLAIGTDGPASNNALDMFREMYLVTALQKMTLKDAAACDAGEVLKMACVGGARAMGLTDCDAIAPGKQADMIVINMSRPNMQPVHNIVKNIVYSGSKENIRLTMVAGKVLYENGEFFIGDTPEYIYAQAEKATRRLTEE